MTDQKSGVRNSVGLLDIATRLPGLLMDAPVMVRGALTGFMARPTAKTSIGKVFQERAARYAERVFIKFGDEQLTYRQANETVNRYAAVLAARGVGHGDVVGVMLRNSPNAVLLMLAVVKCGAIAGMLNYHQRDNVLKHSIGLQGVVAETDWWSRSAPAERTPPVDDGQELSGWRHRAHPTRTRQPCWPRTRRSTSSPRAPPGCEGQRDDA